MGYVGVVRQSGHELDARLKFTEEDAAYAAAAWASGSTQIEIARQFGRRTSAPVCSAIGQFLDRYSGWHVRYSTAFYAERPHGRVITDAGRKALVPQALAAFKVARGDWVLNSNQGGL
jgi:hypothetical protein